jgi:hypothetical protein
MQRALELAILLCVLPATNALAKPSSRSEDPTSNISWQGIIQLAAESAEAPVEPASRATKINESPKDPEDQDEAIGLLPDLKPEGAETWLSLRLTPLVSVLRGDAKLGRRSQTQRLRFSEDLDIGRFMFGFIAEARLYHARRFVFGLEYHKQSSRPRRGHTVQDPVLLFHGRTFFRPDRIRASLEYHWLRADAGLVFFGAWWYVEVLVGGHISAYNLSVRGRPGNETARDTNYDLFLPGVIASLRLAKTPIWGQLEIRNGILASPFGTQYTDGRLSFFWLAERAPARHRRATDRLDHLSRKENLPRKAGQRLR